ncbi:hypothetical protein LCGC14_2316020 [marine sediment metagenome]|uniref:Putative regulatory protein FmdB zinc ribbon domain-containing protein n=1 Tax=marine sediment metagenome TaxID=412755 RepID=A0A0F9FE49_9ZZZZ
MPIYEYYCNECEVERMKLQEIGSDAPQCPHCRVGMTQKPTHPAMIKWKGEGGFPSLRKAYKGTSPYTSSYGRYGD